MISEIKLKNCINELKKTNTQKKIIDRLQNNYIKSKSMYDDTIKSLETSYNNISLKEVLSIKNNLFSILIDRIYG